MENFINLITEKGELFVSRKSVESPYRMGLRFKGLNEQDQYILAQMSDKLGYKFQLRQKRARVISNKLIYTLFNMSEDIEVVMANKILQNPVVCKTFNEYDEKVSEKTSNEVVMVEVDEDLPF